MTFRIREPIPSLAEKVILQITIAPDAEPGQRELRLATANGLSNPLFFHVGQLPEFRKEESKNSAGSAGPARKTRRSRRSRPAASREPEMNITLPAVVNGQIMPGGVDRYRFQARKGQHLVVAVSARELIPYLADAVPGWFQAAVALYDAKGNELAYDDHYRFHPDPVLYCKIPKDGQYVLEIRDALYRGREDFVYRIAVGELPFVTSVFPLGGPAGPQTPVELKGWNLPVQKLTMDAKDKAAGNSSAFRPQRGSALQQRAFCRGYSAGMSGKGTEQRSGRAPNRSRCPLLSTGASISRATGTFSVSKAGRPANRRRSRCPQARFAAGFRAQTDRRRRPAIGV